MRFRFWPAITLPMMWCVSLILPHFQSELSIQFFILDIGITFLIFCSFVSLLRKAIIHEDRIKQAILFIVFGGFTFGVVGLRLGDSRYYELWSRLGAGTMKLNGHVFVFGDLSHLTSAATCEKQIVAAQLVCDPWGRLFNQNSHIPELLRFFHFTNLYFIGFTFLGLFVFSILRAVITMKLNNSSIFFFILSPVTILAIDRGNELLTIALILGGLYLLRSDIFPFSNECGALLLFSAVVFKFWPLFLVFGLLLFHWRKLSLFSNLILLFSFVYTIAKFDEIKKIFGATQHGSPLGLSFGLKLLISSELTNFQQFLFICSIVLIVLFLFRRTKSSLNEIVSSKSGLKFLTWISPVMLAYFGVWLISDSFVYRMVILIPIVILLSARQLAEFEWTNILLASILTTVVSSKLQTTLIFSSSLALYFLLVIVFTFIKHIDLYTHQKRNLC